MTQQLSKLTTPKDDVTGELKTVKLDSRKKLEETEQEADELAKALEDARKLNLRNGRLKKFNIFEY